MNPEDLRVHERVFVALIEARRLAEERSAEIWQYAVDFSFLQHLGAKSTDFRVWLVSGVIVSGEEITQRTAAWRSFRGINQPLSKSNKRPVCILSDKGLELLQTAGMNPFNFDLDRQVYPSWCSENRELRFGGQLIKRFRWDAPNQLRLLQVFEDQGWPEAVSGVFPEYGKVNYKRRLHDTIKCLNRRQSRALIRFHGDGTGLGVQWRPFFPGSTASTKYTASGNQNCSLTLGRE